jgi:TctA family transporter
MLIPYLISLLIAQGEEIGWGFLGLGLLCLAIPIIWFIIAIMLCIWVYRDAESRGMSGALWLIIVLITGLLGLVIYLIVRKDKTQAKAPPPPP